MDTAGLLMDPVNRVKCFYDHDWEEDDPEGIDFAELKPIELAQPPADQFMRGFLTGYVMAAATAFAAIVLCLWR